MSELSSIPQFGCVLFNQEIIIESGGLKECKLTRHTTVSKKGPMTNEFSCRWRSASLPSELPSTLRERRLQKSQLRTTASIHVTRCSFRFASFRFSKVASFIPFLSNWTALQKTGTKQTCCSVGMSSFLMFYDVFCVVEEKYSDR